MLVFIDESGDPGFRVEEGSSPIFVVAMAIFDNHDDARATDQAIRAALERLKVRPEFKFNKCSNLVRDGFFEAVSGCRFQVRAIVVKKENVYSPHLRVNKEDFYRYFVRQMMANDGRMLERASVVIDGSGDRVFKNALATYLRRHLGGKLASLRFSDSRRDALVQLADMAAGAIARSYRIDRQEAGRWRMKLQPKIADIWEFK